MEVELVRDAHEILTETIVPTKTQVATVRTHHTMFAHLGLEAPATVTPGADLTLTISLVRWDDQSPVTDEDREIAISIDGQAVTTVATVNGTASTILVLADPGTYRVSATHPLVQAAEIEVVVA